MNPLTIETTYDRDGYQIKKITGFTAFQLDRLNQMPYQDMKKEFFKMIYERNGIHLKQNDVLHMWVGADALLVEVHGGVL